MEFDSSTTVMSNGFSDRYEVDSKMIPSKSAPQRKSEHVLHMRRIHFHLLSSDVNHGLEEYNQYAIPALAANHGINQNNELSLAIGIRTSKLRNNMVFGLLQMLFDGNFMLVLLKQLIIIKPHETISIQLNHIRPILFR